MRHFRSYFLIGTIFLMLFVACNVPKQTTVQTEPEAPVEVEVRNLDTLVVRPTEPMVLTPEAPNTLPVYRSSQKLDIDILHTKLDLRFNWEEEAVIAKATLTLTPYFAPIEEVVLDAKGFDIHSITLLNTGERLSPNYDGRILSIPLKKSFHRGEELRLYIDYTAHPSEGESGSAAITSDKGLFFINPRGEEGDKPQQIWTQGETEFNSRWFPTLDQPNERCTQEITMTVQDRFKTLSNGNLVNSTQNPDGTRTDHWKMDEPHAPYLFMVAVGEFAVVSDTWKNKKVDYYVEQDYEEDARDIFAHTPEMLTYFSDLVGVEYPWDKYAQVIVRDYVSGAMENTSAVIFGDFVQKHKRSLIDEDNDYIVAHEMFHHWFGDYVTCESWSNLTLNEGFANYAEYLWFEHKYGKDRAASHRMQEIQGYLFQANDNVHALIDFGYAHKEAMFDQHSYNKGGLVLHMLRNYVGDDAFFASLNKYLVDHAHSAVEVHDLRIAFEDVTGEDLNWFFDQWYLDAGHPLLAMDYAWDDSTNILSVDINQTQDPETSVAIFKIPTELEVYYTDGTRERIDVELNQRSQKLTFELVEAPALVVLDPDRVQLAPIQCEYDAKEYALLYDYRAPLELRVEAISALSRAQDSLSVSTVESALSDPFWSVRKAALANIDWNDRPDLQSKLADMAAYDSHSQVKAEAIYALGTIKGNRYTEAIAKGINMQDAYPVVGASIRTLHEVDPQLCEQKLGSLLGDDHPEIVAAISSIYGASKDTSHLKYFAKHMGSVNGLPALDFYESFQTLLAEVNDKGQSLWMAKTRDVAIDQSSSPYTRIAAARMIMSHLAMSKKDSARQKELKSFVEEILEKETNSEVRSIYRQLLGS